MHFTGCMTVGINLVKLKIYYSTSDRVTLRQQSKIPKIILKCTTVKILMESNLSIMYKKTLKCLSSLTQSFHFNHSFWESILGKFTKLRNCMNKVAISTTGNFLSP